MLVGILLILVTGFLWFLIGLILSNIARSRLNFAAVMGVAEFLIFLMAWGFLVDWPVLLNQPLPRLPELCGLFILGGVLSGFGFWIQQRAMRQGHHGVIWTMTQSAMIFPFLAGIFIFHEPFTVGKISGMGLVLLSFLLLGWNMSIQDRKDSKGMNWFVLALIAFVMIGISQSFTTVPSYWKNWADLAGLRPALFFTGYSLVFTSPMVYRRQWPTRLELKIALALTAVSLAGQYTFYLAIDRLEQVNMVSLAYPLAIGVCILIFLLYSAFFLKEKNSWIGWLGFSLVLTGLFILMI